MNSLRPKNRASYDRIAVHALIMVACLAALAAIGSYLAVAASRFRYPFELEWMEGGVVDHVARVLHGQPLYVAPAPEFVPFTYPPLFYWAGAVAARAIGVGFAATRLVAILSSIVCVGLVALIVRRETQLWLPGVLSAGLFAATYRASGAWFDLGRGDMLFLALTLGAFGLLRFGSSWLSAACAAALITLASLTKQTAFAVALPLAAGALAVSWRRGLVFSMMAVGGMAVTHGFLQITSNGSYGYYVFELPRRFSVRILDSEIDAFWTRDILGHFGIASVLAIAWLFRAAIVREKPAWLYCGATIGMVAGSWLPRMQYGGYDNTLIPAYAIIAILAGLSLHVMMGGHGRLRHPLLSVAAALLVLLQMGMLAYDPRAEIPTSQDRQEGDWLLSRLSGVPGGVLVPFHGYLSVLVGGGPAAHRMAVSDVLGCDPHGAGVALRQHYERLIREERFGAIVLDRDDWFFMEAVHEHYPVRTPAFRDSTAFWPRTGWRVRPLWLYLRGETGLPRGAQ